MNRLHLAMGIVTFCKRGKVKYANVSIGGRGDCVNFGLLGRCLEDCTFWHVAITVPDDRQQLVNKTFDPNLGG